MSQEKDPKTNALEKAFNFLFGVEYKRTSMFFIELSRSRPPFPTGKTLSRQFGEAPITFQSEMKKFIEGNHQRSAIRVINSVNLECSAHGVFNKFKLGNVFLDFLEEIFNYKGEFFNINKLKLNISGFNFNHSSELYEIRKKSKLNNEKLPPHAQDSQNCEFSFISRLKEIVLMKRANLTSLEIRINNVRDCKKSDLKDVLGLGFYDSLKKDQINEKSQQKSLLTNLSLELSDWMFFKIVQSDKKGQKMDMNKSTQNIKEVSVEKKCITDWLKFDEFESIVLGSIFKQGPKKQQKQCIHMESMQRLRLELSTLCYEGESFKNFISTIKPGDYEENKTSNEMAMQQKGNEPKKDENQVKNVNYKFSLRNKKVTNKVQYFHYLTREFIKDIVIVVMPGLSQLELDFRNWHKDFQMKDLKDELININREYEEKMIDKDIKKTIEEQRQSKIFSKGKEEKKQPKTGESLMRKRREQSRIKLKLVSQEKNEELKPKEQQQIVKKNSLQIMAVV